MAQEQIENDWSYPISVRTVLRGIRREVFGRFTCFHGIRLIRLHEYYQTIVSCAKVEISAE
jgi:hypothetical protein